MAGAPLSLFLVALLPPEPVRGQLWALKQEVHALTGSRNALRLPPYLTLVPPTRQPAGFEAAARAALRAFAATQSPCPLHLDGFAWFADRTLFVRVVADEPVRALHAALWQWCALRLPALRPEARPFTPHLTLATRDLPAAQVPALRRVFAVRTFRASSAAAALTLFRHDGQHWEMVEEFALGGGKLP